MQEWQRKIAGTLSSVGSALSTRSKSQKEGDVFADIATSMAASQASSEVEDWLRGYGNARIQLNPDHHLSLRNAQAELLLPLRETKNNLWFTQGSVHRSDNRLQSNLGLGWRYFAKSWMAGGNVFFDYDYTGRHSRGGLGLEFWRNDLKFSTNAYFRLSGWRDSRAMEDYEARPADGWDIRAEAWLPAYPQLGGKLTWEQYYGNEVGMSGASERFSDPHRLTAGLSWTPVPLITLTAEHTLGNGGGHDARVGMEFRWQPGVPLSRQMDSSAVGYMRSLAGNRYDFVSRNNDIILEYRKKQVIFLSLPEQVSGRSGTTVSLHATIRSGHGLDHITWQAGAFSAAGGKIDDLGGGDFLLTLPPYTPGKSGQNSWMLSAVATDSRGNTSSPAQTLVSAIPGQLSAARSTFIPAESSLPADGHTTQTLTLTLADDSRLPVDLNAGSISIHREILSGSPQSATLSPLTRQAPGVYTVTVTAGVQSGSFRLTPAAQGLTLPVVTVHVSGTLAPGKSGVTVTPDMLTANGRERSVIRFIARDAQGEPATGIRNVSFALSAVAAPNITAADPALAYTLTPVVSEGEGVYTASLTGRQAGVVTLRPRVDGRPVGDLSAQVTFSSEATSGRLIAFTRDKNEAKASGEDEVHLRASVRDAQDNPVPNQTVLFGATNGAQLSSDAVVTDSNGDAEVTLTSTSTGASEVTASLYTSRLTQNVRFTADNNSAQIPEGYLVVLRDNAVADGMDTAKVGLLVTDRQYNPLSGVEVRLSGDNGVILNNGAPVTDKNGEIYAILQSTVAGTSNITAEINGSRRTIPVHFIASHRNPVIVSVSAEGDRQPSDGRSEVSVSATVTDTAGNALPDTTISFSSGEGVRLSAATGVTNEQGVAKVRVRSVTAGTFTVTASIRGSRLGTDVHFVPDRNSAQIERGHLVVLTNNQPVGGQDRLGVLVTDAGHNPLPGIAVKFSADNGAMAMPAEATTDQNGEFNQFIVSTTRAGTVKGTVTLENGNAASMEVAFVSKAARPLKAPADVVMKYGDAVFTTAPVTGGNGSPLSVKSANEEAVAVVLDGNTVKVTALKVTPAPVVITVSQAATVDTEAPQDATFTVKVNPGALTALKPAPVTVNVRASDDRNAATHLEKADGFITGTKLAYSSDKPDVATVDANGKVTGVKAGTAKITVTETRDNYTTLNEMFEVAVKDVVTVTLVPASVTVGTSESQGKTLTATVTRNGTVVPGKHVVLHTSQLHFRANINTTDENGQAAFYVWGDLSGSGHSYDVTVTNNDDDTDSFIARTTVGVQTVFSINLSSNNGSPSDGDWVKLTAAIKDSDGSAVSNKNVIFHIYGGNPDTRNTTSTTDENGQATIEIKAKAGADYVIQAEGEGCGEWSDPVHIKLAPKPSKVLLEKDRDGTEESPWIKLTATVTDSNGSPVSGAPISFQHINGSGYINPNLREVSSKTSSSGIATAEAESEPGKHGLIVACSGEVCSNQVWVNNSASGTPVQLSHIEGPEIIQSTDQSRYTSFKVIATQGGTPVSGATITFKLGDGLEAEGETEVDTNGEGVATIRLRGKSGVDGSADLIAKGSDDSSRKSIRMVFLPKPHLHKAECTVTDNRSGKIHWWGGRIEDKNSDVAKFIIDYKGNGGNEEYDVTAHVNDSHLVPSNNHSYEGYYAVVKNGHYLFRGDGVSFNYSDNGISACNGEVGSSNGDDSNEH